MSDAPKRVFTQVYGAVAAVIERDGKFLLVKENFGETHPDHGKWSHPAGWIEVGEDAIEGVKREVCEETGYEFFPEHLLGVYLNVRSDLAISEGTPHSLKLVFLGSISEKPTGTLSDDVSEAKWFTPEEIFAMGQTALRSLDIKKMIQAYASGTRYSLECISQSVQEPLA